MSIKDLINSAFEKDASSFESAFNDIMDEKMESAITSKYNEMFDSSDDLEEGYKKKMKEEDDEDEEDDDDEEEDEDED